MTAKAEHLTLSAASLAAPLADLRHTTLAGEVLATFQRSAYLDLGGRIVALAAVELERGPLTITVHDFAAVREYSATGGVVADGGLLHLGAIAVDLRGAEVWDPSLPRIPADAGWTASAVVVDELWSAAPIGSVVALLGPAAASDPLLDALRRGLDAIGRLLDNPDRPSAPIQVIGQEVAGRGPGLTPSGDDLLMGVMLALSAWPSLTRPGYASRVCNLLAESAGPRTTRISAAYLGAASKGWAADPWHALVRSLTRQPEAVRDAVRRLTRIGETSGADSLTGFCWAWRRLED